MRVSGYVACAAAVYFVHRTATRYHTLLCRPASDSKFSTWAYALAVQDSSMCLALRATYETVESMLNVRALVDNLPGIVRRVPELAVQYGIMRSAFRAGNRGPVR